MFLSTFFSTYFDDFLCLSPESCLLFTKYIGIVLIVNIDLWRLTVGKNMSYKSQNNLEYSIITEVSIYKKYTYLSTEHKPL